MLTFTVCLNHQEEEVICVPKLVPRLTGEKTWHAKLTPSAIGQIKLSSIFEAANVSARTWEASRLRRIEERRRGRKRLGLRLLNHTKKFRGVGLVFFM